MKRKKTPRQKLKKKLELAVKTYVKERDKFTCQFCDKVVSGSNCHASHIIPVSADGRMAFDPDNLKVLCYHCHMNFWHKNPLEATDKFTKKFPGRYEKLQEKHLSNQKKGTIQMEELEERLNQINQMNEYLITNN